MFIGGDVFAIHGERRINVTRAEVAQYLVEATALFDDVDHMANRIVAGGKGNGSDGPAHAVATQNFFSPPRQMSIKLAERNASERSMQQSWNVAVGVAASGPGGRRRKIIRTGTMSLAGGDEKFFALHGERSGIPISGNESERAEFALACA